MSGLSPENKPRKSRAPEEAKVGEKPKTAAECDAKYLHLYNLKPPGAPLSRELAQLGSTCASMKMEERANQKLTWSQQIGRGVDDIVTGISNLAHAVNDTFNITERMKKLSDKMDQK